VLKISGNGLKSTQKFTVVSDWDLGWTYDCGDAVGGRGNFVVQIYNGIGTFIAVAVNQLGPSGQDVSYFHQGGTYYLQIISQCAWHVVVHQDWQGLAGC
jgi:hypothetical protein